MDRTASLLFAAAPIAGRANQAVVVTVSLQGVLQARAHGVAIAAGFALPNAVMMLAAQRLWPHEPADPVALMSMLGSGIPIAVIPVFGAALADGNGDIAFIAMAAFVALAGLLNARLPRKPIAAPAFAGD
jgi:hypothetical protein